MTFRWSYGVRFNENGHRTRNYLNVVGETLTTLFGSRPDAAYPPSPLPELTNHSILLDTGSTRLKAGTFQKLALNRKYHRNGLEWEGCRESNGGREGEEPEAEESIRTFKI